MAEPAAIYTPLDTDLFAAGNFLREPVLIQQFAQNLWLLLTQHDHSGDPGDGALLALSNPVAVMYYGAAASS